MSGLVLGLEEVSVFDNNSENRDTAVEAVQSVSEFVLGLGLGLGLGSLGLRAVACALFLEIAD